MSRFTIVLAVAAAALFSLPAQAETINIGVLFGDTLKPYVNAAIEGVIFLGLAWAGFELKRRWGIQLDETYRVALHDFAKRQAAELVNRGAVKVEGLKIEVNNKALADVANTAITALPLALQHFGISPTKVEDIIKSYVPTVPAVAAEVSTTATPKP